MLGKKPAQPELVKLHLASYIPTSALPTPPKSFGWDYLVKDWPMLLNGGEPVNIDGREIAPLGDCAIVGGLHETQLLLASARKTINLTDACAVENYSAITDYDPDATNPITGENPTDQGTAVVDLMDYRQKVGLIDGDGKRHKIAAALALHPGDLDQLAAAVWLFGAAGLGFALPQSADDQFADGQPWSVVSGSPQIGGHYVPITSLDPSGLWNGITWAAKQPITAGFIQEYCDEAWVCLSEEMMLNGVNLDGFKWDQLVDDIRELAKEVGEPAPRKNPGRGKKSTVVPISDVKAEGELADLGVSA